VRSRWRFFVPGGTVGTFVTVAVITVVVQRGAGGFPLRRNGRALSLHFGLAFAAKPVYAGSRRPEKGGWMDCWRVITCSWSLFGWQFALDQAGDMRIPMHPLELEHYLGTPRLIGRQAEAWVAQPPGRTRHQPVIVTGAGATGVARAAAADRPACLGRRRRVLRLGLGLRPSCRARPFHHAVLLWCGCNARLSLTSLTG
jgi:hypothetical protein